MCSLQNLERVLESSWSAIANGVAIDHVATIGVPLILWVSLADTCLRVGTVHEAMDTVDAPMIGENRQLVTNEPVDFEK
jgi:hypothetical protein